MALEGLRIADAVERGREVEIVVDGRGVKAREGESVACALHAAGIRELRRSPKGDGPRGMFCLMGVCQECVVRIDGRAVASCLEGIREGMVVELGGVHK